MRPIVAELVNAWSEIRVSRRRAQVVEIPDVPREVVAEVEKRARIPDPMKATLVATGPEVAARGLEALGLEASHGPFVGFAAAVGMLVVSDLALSAELSRLGEKFGARKAAQEAAPEPPTPPAAAVP